MDVARDGKTWTWPLTWPGVDNPALGPGQPSLIFVVVLGDLFYRARPTEHINRVCATIAASPHLGLLCSKYTPEMAAYFAALDPRTVRRWQPSCGSASRRKPGMVCFVSIAPMLEPVMLPPDFLSLAKWVIVNGEQAKLVRRRPMKTAWVRAIHDQRAAAHIPLFIKGAAHRRTRRAGPTKNTSVSGQPGLAPCS